MISFKAYSPPYVRGDIVTLDPEKEKQYVEQGSADFVVSEVSKPAKQQSPEAPKKRGRPAKQQSPEAPKKRGRPRKNPASPIDGPGD